jgi:AcrR family transcriptional regulator
MPPKSTRSTADAGAKPRRAPAKAAAVRKPRAKPAAVESPWAPGGDRDRLRASKREAVLRVAAQMFNEKGFHATSLDDVAERLHITKPTLYYYVKNKDEILFECVNIGMQLLQDAVIEEHGRGGSAFDKLKAAMRRYVEIVTADFGMCVIRVGEDPLPAAGRRKLRRFKAALDAQFRELIRLGIEEGSIRPCDPKIAAFTIAGALSWIGRWYRPNGPLTPDEIATQCFGLLVGGLCSPDPAASRGRAATVRLAR